MMPHDETIDYKSIQETGAQLKVFEAAELVYSYVLDNQGTVELGRQRRTDPPPYTPLTESSTTRLVIAPLEDTSVSRQHVRLELLGGGAARCINTSSNAEVQIEEGPQLAPRQTFEGPLPLVITVGSRVVRVEKLIGASRLASLGRPTRPPGQEMSGPKRFRDVMTGASVQGDEDQLVAWLRATMNVFHSAASSPDFLSRAAQAAAAIVDLDVAAVVQRAGGDWRAATTHFATRRANPDSWAPSRRMLEHVRRHKTTFRYQPDLKPFEGGATQADVIAMVAAPILDPDGEVIGVLFGDKRHADDQPNVAPQITELEAMLIELLASGVAAGIARLQQEEAALSARVMFEQFFTPELARQLEVDPQLLEGRDAEVSIAFCDIRSFSSIAEKIGAEQTLAWIYDVMSAMSDCVLQENGVLVDYQGDQVMAMWGAPLEQPDHAARACRATVAMLQRLPDINSRWESQIGHPTRLGIGINTGPARVGNTGSRQKFKYGPLGNTVNIASRIQGATKYLGADLLVSGATSDALPLDQPRRRLCQVKVANIQQPITLFEVPAAATRQWEDLALRYERGLQLSIRGDLRAATRELGQVIETYPDDGPTLQLLSRVVETMKVPAAEFNPIWELSGK